MKKIFMLIIVCGMANFAFSQNFGIDQPSPTEKLDVNGYIKTSQGIKFPDGSVQTSAAQPRHIIWSGYCNYHGTAGGWNVYCNNSVDFNSASGYISPDGGGTFTIQKSGYYRMNFWCISLMSSYAHTYLVINGTLRHYGHEYVHGTWSDNFVDWTWPFNAGETFYLQLYQPGGGYAFHSGNGNGQYSRMQVTYMGNL